MIDVLRAHDGTKFPLSEVLYQRALGRLRSEPYDTVITYQELTEAISLPPDRDPRARRAVLRAGRTLLREDHKKLVNVRTVGYRIVKPNEHAVVATGERARSRRWLRRALQTVTYVSLRDLTADEIAKLMTEQARTALEIALCRRLERPKQLPARKTVTVPSTKALLALMTRKQQAS